MDEFNYLQFLNDDNDLLAAEELLADDFPTFAVSFNQMVADLSPNIAAVPHGPESTGTKTKTTTTTTQQDEAADVSRFPVVSNEDIEELKSVAANKNTSRSTKQRTNVFNSWCSSRHLDINIETMAPEELDKVLSKFYAEVKKKDGDDYEPESLKIMQSSIERYLKEKGYPVSIVRSREFHNSQEILNAKAISLRQQGRGKRPNKSQPLTPDEESALWEKGQLGDFNGKVLTNVNFKNLTEQLGLRGRQEHYDAYVEDLVVRQREDGSEVVEFRAGPTKTRNGGLVIRRRTTPQVICSTDGGEHDPVRLFKLWLSKRPEGMKDNGPLYLSIINRPKSKDVWYTKIRMGQNTIGTIMKSMASCLLTNKKITNHSMRKTLVAKLKKSGQPRHVICEITGHSRESSLDDYDEIDENQRKELSHIISGFSKAASSQNCASESSKVSQNTANGSASNQAIAVKQRVPLSSIPHIQQQSQMYQAMGFNPVFHPAGFPGFQPCFASQYTAAFASSSAPVPAQNYSGCTFNFSYSKEAQKSPKPQKKRRAYIIESDDED